MPHGVLFQARQALESARYLPRWQQDLLATLLVIAGAALLVFDNLAGLAPLAAAGLFILGRLRHRRHNRPRPAPPALTQPRSSGSRPSKSMRGSRTRACQTRSQVGGTPAAATLLSGSADPPYASARLGTPAARPQVRPAPRFECTRRPMAGISFALLVATSEAHGVVVGRAPRLIGLASLPLSARAYAQPGIAGPIHRPALRSHGGSPQRHQRASVAPLLASCASITARNGLPRYRCIAGSRTCPPSAARKVSWTQPAPAPISGNVGRAAEALVDPELTEVRQGRICGLPRLGLADRHSDRASHEPRHPSSTAATSERTSTRA
jgi:hypothetical protein